jgi:hypothetical protein
LSRLETPRHIPGERRSPRSTARTELLQKGRDVVALIIGILMLLRIIV